MKKFLIIAFGVLSLIFTGCLKDTPPTNFSNLPPIVEMEYPAGANFSGLGSGLQYFIGGALTYPSSDVSDTAIILINLASPSVEGKEVTGTVGFSQALLSSYNSEGLGLTYLQMPDSDYSIINPNFDIPAGTRIDTVRIVFFPDKISPTSTYLLPLAILTASNYTISGNFGVVYFSTIGNPLAGAYLWDYTRWNAQDSSGSPVTADVGLNTTLLPDNPTQVEVASGYYIGPRYVIDFTNNNGVLSNFSVSFNTADLATMAAAGVTITSGPNILIADSANLIFRFQYIAFNGSGYRYIIDKYYP